MAGAIAWGRRLLGKVDAVPGRFHVATQFWMFCYLPLVPLGTWIVTSEKRRGMSGTFQGIRIPLSMKSWAMAWIRAIMGALFTIMAIASISITCLTLSGDRSLDAHVLQQFLTITAIIGVLLIAPYLTPGIGRATESRAAEVEHLLAGGTESAGSDSVRAG